MSSIRRAVAMSLPVAVSLSVLTAAPAFAKGPQVLRSGHCSAKTVWKLKAAPDNGRLEVAFEVDSNRVGRRWTWSLSDRGVRLATGTARTVAPSGSFEVRRRITNRAGTDSLVARARNTVTGEVCTATLRI